MKNVTLEETTNKSFGQIWGTLTTEQSEYLKDYINRQRQDAKKWQAERMYSKEEVLDLLEFVNDRLPDLYSRFNPQSELNEWFEQFKK